MTCTGGQVIGLALDLWELSFSRKPTLLVTSLKSGLLAPFANFAEQLHHVHL